MPGDEGWFDQFVNGLPESHVFKRGQAWVAALDRLDLAALLRDYRGGSGQAAALTS